MHSRPLHRYAHTERIEYSLPVEWKRRRRRGGSGDLTADQGAELEWTEPTVDGRGIRMVVIRTLGMDEYFTGFAAEETIRGAAELPRMLAKIENVQASFQIMRPSTSSRTTLLLCTLPPKNITRAAQDFDALLK